jgi:hypothetical protein
MYLKRSTEPMGVHTSNLRFRNPPLVFPREGLSKHKRSQICQVGLGSSNNLRREYLIPSRVQLCIIKL